MDSGEAATADVLLDIDLDETIHIDKKLVQNWNGNLSASIDYIIPFPCIQRDIQQLILKRSIYPQPAIAYIAAMSIVCACIGRNIAYENIKGNMMFIGMAESGEGKDFPFKMAEKILESVEMGHVIEGKPASGAALFEAMSAQPSMLLHIDEFGHFLDGTNGKKASIYAKEVSTALTEAYTSGSAKIRGKRTKGNDPLSVIEPNICVFGLTTEGQVFNGLSSSEVSDGSLARYMMVFGDSDIMPVRIEKHDNTIPQKIIDDLNKLIDDNKKEFFLCSTQIKVSQEFEDAKWDLMEKMKKKSIAIGKNSSKAIFKPFYNRIAVRANQACLTVDRCTSVKTLNWFADIEVKTVDVFVKKFMHMGADNENERLSKLIQAKIKESGKKGITAKDLLSSTRQVPTYIRKQFLQEMEDSGMISKISARIDGSRRASHIYYWMK